MNWIIRICILIGVVSSIITHNWQALCWALCTGVQHERAEILRSHLRW